MSFCDYCLIKEGLCAHLKEIMKHTLRNTDIDGSKLCPLVLSATEGEKDKIKLKEKGNHSSTG